MEHIKQWWKDAGVLGAAAVAAAALKLALFYNMMSVQSNFVLVWAITAFFIALLFSSFRNKWIPAVIFLILSVLMFADAAYASFFNRYLSVNMMGAAGFLGDVGESLKAVLKPKFFLLLADNILIFAALTQQTMRKRRAKAQEPEDGVSGEEEQSQNSETADRQETGLDLKISSL